MINLNLLPCINCIHYQGTRYEGKTEKTEFVSCEESETGDAEDILTIRGKNISCRFQIREYEGE